MKRWIHAASQPKLSKEEFSKQVAQIVDDYLPDNHKLRDLSIYYDRNFQIMSIENSEPMISAKLDLSPFIKSRDVQGAATEIIDYLDQCVKSNKLVFSENYVEFLNKYRSYFDRIDRAIREVASRYDSDMRCDLDLIVKKEYNARSLVQFIVSLNKIFITEYDVSVSYALGLEAVVPKPLGIPDKYTDGNVEIYGPYGIYYNGSTPDLSLKYFDADLRRFQIAVRDYFESLKHNLETGERWGLKTRYEDDYPERAEERAQREAELKNAKPIRRKWSSVVSQLSRDLEEMDDPLYEQTKAGDYILSICGEVESALNYMVEPSIQAGRGGVWIYDEANNDEVIVSDYDFETFDSEIIDMALSSKNMTEFKNRYKDYLLSL